MQAMVIAIAAFSAALGLMLLRVPVAVAAGIVGLAGMLWLQGWASLAVGLGGAFPADTPLVIPLFVMMGVFVSQTGLSRRLYDAAYSVVGQCRGGLAMAALIAGAAFGAICGSAVAAAATMCRTALPDMRRHGYADGVSAASIATGSTLGLLLPPSILLMLYALLTGQSLARLYIAALLPGLLGMALYLAAIWLRALRDPKAAPAGPPMPWPQRGRRLADIWPLLLLFMLVIGGMFMGWLDAEHAGALGAVVALIFALSDGALGGGTLGGGGMNGARFKASLLETAQTSGMVFLVLIGVGMFAAFLMMAGLPSALAADLAASGINPVLFLLLLALAYWLLGSVLDDLAAIVLTLPFVFPMAQALGIDAIWFGIYLLTIVEIGMVLPPLGMLLFVMQGSTGVNALAIMRGMLPFMLANLLRLALLIAFPALALALPGMMD